MKQLDAASTKWRALGLGQRMLLVAAVIGISFAGYTAYSNSQKITWAVLYANTDDATAASVMAKLDAHGIPHQLSGNGTRIEVPASQLASTRLTLASEGVTGQPVPEGFDQIFSNQGLASSDFEQRVNYQRALEGELAKTLLTMDNVAGASVKLTIPQQSVFIGDGTTSNDKPTASVMLSLRQPLTAAQVETVTNLVASSIEGLTPDQVTIASSDGTLLHAAGDSTTSATSTKNIAMTSDYENELSNRLTALARTLTGSAAATVEVRATMDFTQSDVEHEVIDPTKNVPTADHSTSETWTGTGSQVAGSTGASAGAASSGSGNGTYASSDKTTTFTPGDRTVTKSSQTTPTVTRLSIAVVVPVANVTATTLAGGATAGDVPATSIATAAAGTSAVDDAMLKRVIGSAAGIDATRGDTIEVAMVPAVATDSGQLLTVSGGTSATAIKPVAAKPTTLLAEAAGAGALGMFLLVMMGRRRSKRKAKANSSSPLIIAESGKKGKGKKGAATAPAPVLTATAAPQRTADPDREAVDEIKGDLERMLAESPESLAALLSSWMAK